MKYLYVTCFAFILQLSIPTYSQAPSIQWQTTIGSDYSDNGRAIRQTPDGGYIVAGRVNNYSRDVSQPCEVNNGWIAKLSSTGVIQWEKNFGLVGNDFINSISLTADGGYILAGFTSLAVGWQGGEDFLIIKIDASGNLTWQKTYGGSDDDRAHSALQTTDGGYIVAGETRSTNGDVIGQHGQWDAWILKLNASGNLSWQKTMGGTDAESAYSIQQTTDGGYIVAGSARSTNGDVSALAALNADWWLVKLTSTGSISWNKCFGSTLTESAYSVIQTSDGGYAIAGYAATNDGTVVAPAFIYDNYWIIKTDASGNLSWQKVYGGNGYDVARSIQQTSDGGFIIAGHSDSQNSGNVSGPTSYIFDNVWVIRLNATGTLLWQKKMGGELQDQAWDVRQTTDGGYIIAGNSNSTTGDVSPRPNDHDLWIVKLGPDGVLPVSLENFSAAINNNNNTVKCKWTTLSEINVSRFEVERSINGIDFISVGKVMAKGDAGQPYNYAFDDASASAIHATLYYRLRMIDVNGSSSLSSIVRVDKSKEAHLSIFPNPVAEEVNVHFAAKESKTIITIRDVTGTTVRRWEFNTNVGAQTFRLNVSGLAGGTYVIITGTSKPVTFIKQ